MRSMDQTKKLEHVSWFRSTIPYTALRLHFWVVLPTSVWNYHGSAILKHPSWAFPGNLMVIPFDPNLKIKLLLAHFTYTNFHYKRILPTLTFIMMIGWARKCQCYFPYINFGINLAWHDMACQCVMAWHGMAWHDENEVDFILVFFIYYP